MYQLQVYILLILPFLSYHKSCLIWLLCWILLVLPPLFSHEINTCPSIFFFFACCLSHLFLSLVSLCLFLSHIKHGSNLLHFAKRVYTHPWETVTGWSQIYMCSEPYLLCLFVTSIAILSNHAWTYLQICSILITKLQL